MFEALETGIGLEVVLWFQENRTAWMETMSQILDQLGYDLGYVALFGFIFWAINKRHGIRLAFALVVIGTVSFALKDILMRPRPYLVSDLVTPVFEADGFGIPSGHTALAVMIWGYIGLWLRKSWVWVLCISYMLLQALGRMIAGVHFPQDIVMAIVVGVVTVSVYYPSANRWEEFWNKQSFSNQLALALIIPIIMAGIIILLPLDTEQTEAYLTLFGLAIGVGIGGIIEARYIQFDAHPQRVKRAIHVVMGGILVLAVLLGLSPVFDMIAETGITAYILRIVRYSLAGFMGVAIVPMLGAKLNLVQMNDEPKPINSSI